MHYTYIKYNSVIIDTIGDVLTTSLGHLHGCSHRLQQLCRRPIVQIVSNSAHLPAARKFRRPGKGLYLNAITFCCSGKESCNPDSFVVLSRCTNIHLEHLYCTNIYESADGYIRIGSSGPLLSWWQVHLHDVFAHGPDIGFRCRHEENDMMRVVIQVVKVEAACNPRLCI